MPKPKPKDGTDEEDHTVVVDRGASGEEDHTVVVDRSASGEEDHTVVVDRSASGEEDHTVVVDRSASGEEDHTVVVDRSASGEVDHTVVVTRGLKSPKVAPRAPAGRRKGMAPPALPEGFGPGDIHEYVPRTIPEPPPLVEPLEPGPDATREPAPAMASVARRSRRGARLTLVLFVFACIGAVVGLVAIALALASR